MKVQIIILVLFIHCLVQSAQSRVCANNAANLEKQDSDLKWVIETWKQCSKNQAPFRCKFKRFVYDFTFEVENKAQGEFYYQTQDIFRLDVRPFNLKDGVTQELGPRGKNFSVKNDKAETWIRKRNQIYAIDIRRKEYQKCELGLLDSFLKLTVQNFCFVPNEKFFSENTFEFPANWNRSVPQKTIHLIVKPKKDNRSWEQQEYLLNARNFQINAIKIVHPGHNSEMVYTFSEYVESSNDEKFEDFEQEFSEFKPQKLTNSQNYKTQNTLKTSN